MSVDMTLPSRLSSLEPFLVHLHRSYYLSFALPRRFWSREYLRPFFFFFLTAALPLFRIFYFIIDFPNSHSYQNVKQYGEERGALESWMFGSLMMDYGSKYVVAAASYVHFWFKEERLWINLLAWADG